MLEEIGDRSRAQLVEGKHELLLLVAMKELALLDLHRDLEVGLNVGDVEVNVRDVELLGQVYGRVELALVGLTEQRRLEVGDAIVEGAENVADLLDVSVVHVDRRRCLDVAGSLDVDVAAFHFNN